jgi:hypothetical protein
MKHLSLYFLSLMVQFVDSVTRQHLRVTIQNGVYLKNGESILSTLGLHAVILGKTRNKQQMSYNFMT